MSAVEPQPVADDGAGAVGQARILDRGYRPYDGPRRGPGGAVRALTVHSMQRALGLKRSAAQKVLPLLAVLIAYLPAVVFIGLSVLIEDTLLRNQDLIPTYSEYYSFISAAIVVFTAFVAPELLCPDRRSGMLGLYLASPLTRSTYLASKALAVIGLLALVTLGPPLLLLIAFVLLGKGPDGPGGVARLLAEVVAGGAAVAMLQASLSLAVSSTTTRKAAASAGIILILLASAAVSEALVDGAGAAPEWFCVNLLEMPFELVTRIYGDVNTDPAIAAIPTGTIVAAYVGWTALFAGFTWLRYRRVAVDR